MQAYRNNPELKESFVAEIKRHQEADQIVQGTYGTGTGKNWKGCAVGCSIKSLNKLEHTKYSTDDHTVYETALGMPEWLAQLEDKIFEGLPVKDAKQWPLRFSQAVPVGADLGPIKWKFCAFILSRNIERVLTLDIADSLKEEVVSAIRGVLKLQEDAIRTGIWDESAARSAESAARSAASAASATWSATWIAMWIAASAESAAWSAVWSAENAAWSAVWSAESAARSAGRNAGRSAVWSAVWSAENAAWSAEYIVFADKLIELLEQA